MKKLFIFIFVLLMVIISTGCGAPMDNTSPQKDAATEVREFTDSVGRTVTLPVEINKIAVTGPFSQIVVFALAPDMLVGIASAWDASAEQYLATEYYDLPELGQLYGGNGELNLETLLASGAQVVIDVGEPKDTIVEDLDMLQEQVGIPFVHISAFTANMDQTYLALGELLGRPEEAKVLADYCEKIYTRTKEIASSVEKVDLLYITGNTGLNVIAKGSYHAEVIDLLSNNLAIVNDPSSKGTGNEVDMEQLLNWDPDVIIFAPDSIYATVGEEDNWRTMTAIKSDTYYEVPMGPYNWMGFPPSVQRYLGMMWMADLLYPEATDYDLMAEIQEYFRLFYHCELTEEEYNALVANSIGKLEN